MSDPIDRRTLAATFAASVVLGSEVLSADTAPPPHTKPPHAPNPSWNAQASCTLLQAGEETQPIARQPYLNQFPSSSAPESGKRLRCIAARAEAFRPTRSLLGVY